LYPHSLHHLTPKRCARFTCRNKEYSGIFFIVKYLWQLFDSAVRCWCNAHSRGKKSPCMDHVFMIGSWFELSNPATTCGSWREPSVSENEFENIIFFFLYSFIYYLQSREGLFNLHSTYIFMCSCIYAALIFSTVYRINLISYVSFSSWN